MLERNLKVDARKDSERDRLREVIGKSNKETGRNLAKKKNNLKTRNQLAKDIKSHPINLDEEFKWNFKVPQRIVDEWNSNVQFVLRKIEEGKRYIFKVETPKKIVRQPIPKKAYPVLENSYTRKYLTLKGPEVHLHVGPEDCEIIKKEYARTPNSKRIDTSIRELEETYKKMGFSDKQLKMAARLSGYGSFYEHINAQVGVVIKNLYEKNKGTDGSVDIYMPGIYLLLPKKMARVGKNWYEFPKKGQKIKY